MTVPEETTCINFRDGQEEAEIQIKQLCTRLLPGWIDLQAVDMQVSRISGGISNLLVKVDPPPPLQPVAVKVFGDKTELLIDRCAERRLLLQLNAAGFGAPVVGLFENGRVEQFLTAKTLTPEEMLDTRFVQHIARRLRAFHDLRLEADAASAAGAAAAATAVGTAPASATVSDASCSSASPQEEPSQWDAIFGWLSMAEGLSFPHDASKQAAFDKVDFAAMRSELAALREVCGRVGSPRVLCHNDLLSGNILVVRHSRPGDEQQQQPAQRGGAAADGEQQASAGTAEACEEDVLAGGELQFIDFEYSCYGPRGFDWGNHFNEYAGFDCVYDRFPSSDQQKAFFRHYLEPGELKRMALKYLHVAEQPQQPQHLQQGEHQPQQKQQQQQDAPVPDGGNAAAEELAAEAGPVPEGLLAAAEEAVLDRLVAEACVYALASHAYWGVWSFIQARYSPIDFDYLDYSRMRWAEYHRRKEEFFELVHRHFPGPDAAAPAAIKPQ